MPFWARDRNILVKNRKPLVCDTSPDCCDDSEIFCGGCPNDQAPSVLRARFTSLPGSGSCIANYAPGIAALTGVEWEIPFIQYHSQPPADDGCVFYIFTGAQWSDGTEFWLRIFVNEFGAFFWDLPIGDSSSPPLAYTGPATIWGASNSGVIPSPDCFSQVDVPGAIRCSAPLFPYDACSLRINEP